MPVRRLQHLGTGALLLCSACDEGQTPQPVSERPPSEVDDRPVVRANFAPPPVTGGTLLVTEDGNYAIASDPGRDLIHVVALQTNESHATVELPEGSRPFRATEDSDGRVHATLRGTGRIATLDPATGESSIGEVVCGNPRGIAFRADAGTLLVACAGGQLATVDPATGDVLQRQPIATDLRDVFVVGDRTLVSRFRAADVLEVSDDGGVSLVATAPVLADGITARVATTAWRTLPLRDDGWLMLHQHAGNTVAPVGGEPNYGRTNNRPCSSVTHPSMSLQRGNDKVVNLGAVPFMALAVDVAVSPDFETFVVASPSQDTLRGQSEAPPRSLVAYSLKDFAVPTGAKCENGVASAVRGDFVAVAFDREGNLLAQTRSQPQLHRFVGDEVTVIELPGDDMSDTGHDLFHLDAGQGVACASCHPEGGEDGLVWQFSETEFRRTPSLNVGLAGTEPFHWTGEMSDADVLVHKIRELRMGGVPLSSQRRTALADWMFELPVDNPVRIADDALSAEGRDLFVAHDCVRCHAGPSLTTNEYAEVESLRVQIPNLHGVALREPYMHDGRAADLRSATEDMLLRFPGPTEQAEGDVEAIVAYLETL